MKILITGATGFIGKRLVKKLAHENHDLYLLVRRGSLEKAKAMFADFKNIDYVIGDITNNDILEQVHGAETLNQSIDAVIHLAASYDLSVGLTEAYASNVVGTQNFLYLLNRMKNLKFFHYISTYAVSGIHPGDFSEEQLDTGAPFPEHYSKTKMQAEALVRKAKFKNTKIRIYRPGIIVGDSKTGEMDKIDGPYYFFRLFSKLSEVAMHLPINILPMSFEKGATMPLLPVDTLVEWLDEMVNHPTEHKIRTYHLVPDERIYIPDLAEQAAKEFGMRLKVQRIPFPGITAKILPYLKIPAEVGPYLQSKTRYLTENLKEDFPKLIAPKLRTYLPILVKKSKDLFT